MEEFDRTIDALVEKAIVDTDDQRVVGLPFQFWILYLGQHQSGVHRRADQEVIARTVKRLRVGAQDIFISCCTVAHSEFQVADGLRVLHEGLLTQSPGD